MITYEQAVAQKRETVLEIVEKLTKAGSRKMDAYALIASETGKSSTWVRRIIGRSPSVRIDLHDALNIRALHDRLCARVAAVADAIEAGNDDLRRQIDATSGGDLPRSARPARAAAPEAQGAAPAGAGAASLPAHPKPSAPAPDAPGHEVLGLTPTAPR